MFDKLLKKILDEKVGLDDAVRDSLFTEIMRAHTLSRSQIGRKEGATFMTPEASLEGDKFINGEKTKNIQKPKSV